MNKKKKKIIIWSIIGALVLALVIWIVIPSNKEIVWSTQTIESGTVEITVTATGYVQPVEKVEIGTQVSGRIEAIYVDFNDRVKAGQLLAELDKSTLNERLTQALASEQSAQAALTLAQQTYNRTKELYENKAATQSDYEQATSQLTQAKSQYENAKTNVREARVNLGYADIYSTIDGVVLDRQVEIGQTVASSFSTPTMFIIAKDLTNMQVEADIDEADIGQVRVGQHVNFTVDAYPKETFTGTVGQIRLQPTVTNNVVTYTVVINTPNPDEKLFPGMTASVEIVTQCDTALLVPMEALNFTPSEDLFKLLDKPQSPESREPREPRSPISPISPSSPSSSGNPSDSKTVWIKSGNSIHPVPVETGINDGVNAILVRGLNQGDTIILNATAQKKETKRASKSFMPGPPERRTGVKKEGETPKE